MPVTNPNKNVNNLPVTPVAVKPGDKVTADNLRNMITMVESLLSHTHDWTDTFDTNCQCNCSRGSL